MDSSRYIIYALVDPRDGEIRYVGKSAKGLYRPRRHQYFSTYKTHMHLPVYCWIRELSAVGLSYGIRILEVFPSDKQLDNAERQWIKQLRNAGAKLTNLTVGGEGALGWVPSQDTRDKIGKKCKERLLDPDYLQQAQKRAREVSQRPKVRVAISKAMGGKPFVDESGKIYQTLRDAGKAIGVNPSTIHKCLCGTRKQAKGHQFKYLDDPRTLYPLGDLRKKKRSKEERIEQSIRQGGRDFCDESGTVYHTQTEAAEALGVLGGNINRCLHGKVSQTGGHTFRYLEEKHE